MKLPFLPTVLIAPRSGQSVSTERVLKQAYLLLTQMLLESENLSADAQDSICITLDDLELMLEGVKRSQQYKQGDVLQLSSAVRYVCNNQITSGDTIYE